jgi:uncharacterized protein with FMN-binding domain
VRRAIATLSLTIAALTFVLRFNPQHAVTFAAGTSPLSGDPGAADPGTSTSTTAAPSAAPDSSPTTSPTTTPPATSPPTTAAPTTTTVAPTTTSAQESRVVDGQVVSTEWGPVQVEITVQGSQIIDVQALQVPNHASRSRQINNYVTPIYRQAALQAQSANFWGVSGATVTWWGYVNSMQSALDAAGI